MDPRFGAVLKNWRDSLVDLSGRNRLLNFRHTAAATLEIYGPKPNELLAGLPSGWSFAEIPEDGVREDDRGWAKDGTIVTQKTTSKALESTLRKLYRDSHQVFTDTGLWVLQLGVGFLRWRDDGTEKLFDAPLLLVPAELERLAPGRFRLVAAQEEEVVANPALAVKMGDLEVPWPDLDGLDLSSAMRAVTRAVRGRPGWEVADRVVVACFRSHKEAMYRDLLDNQDRIARHPIIQAIGLGPAADLPADLLEFTPLDLERIDELQPPEETPLVLDADSSQRQCVAAALEGRTFVMDGPPGTGKSQTIANMIAALMHAGRSVLFVSAKAAALDVVRNRLDQQGLGAYALPLHSHNTTRKAFAKTLGDALVEMPRALGRTTEEERIRLLCLREELSGYAEAMNELRQPLNRSVHQVVGRLAELVDSPLIPLVTDFRELSGYDLQEIIAAAQSLSRAWRPVASRDDFVWRDLEQDIWPHTILTRVIEATDALVPALERHEALAGPLGLDDLGDADRLISLLDAMGSRPVIPPHWLTLPDLGGLVRRVGEFGDTLETLRRCTEQMVEACGPRWGELPPTLTRQAMDLAVRGLDISTLTAGQIRDLAAAFRATAPALTANSDDHPHPVPATAWPLAATTDPSLWRGTETTGDPLPRLTEVVSASNALAAALEQHSALTSAMGWDSLADARRLVELLTYTADRPEVPVGWLTCPDLEQIRVRTTAFTIRADYVRAAFRQAAEVAGPHWNALPPTASEVVPDCEAQLARLAAEGVDPAPLTSRQARELADDFDQTASLFTRAQSLTADAAFVYGFPEPTDFAGVMVLCELAGIATREFRPLAHWLEPKARPAVRAIVDELDHCVSELRKTRAATSDLFREEVLGASDLPAIFERLRQRSSIERLLSTEHRNDRRRLAGLTVTGTWDKQIPERLGQAIAWQDAYRKYWYVAQRAASLLGPYWNGEETDTALIRDLLVVSEHASHLAERVRDQDAFLRQVSSSGAPDLPIARALRALREDLKTWRTGLAPAPAASGRPRLERMPLAEIADWYRQHVPVLRDAAAVAEAVDALLPDAPALTVSQARERVRVIQWARGQETAFRAQFREHEQLLGNLYNGSATDSRSIAHALDWAENVRRDHTFDDRRVQALFAERPDPHLVSCLDLWSDALTGFTALYPPSRREAVAAQVGGSSAALHELASKYTGMATALLRTAEAVETVDAVSERSKPFTVTEAQFVLDHAGEVHDARDALENVGVTDAKLFGELYSRDDTDLDALEAALAWVRRIRELVADIPAEAVDGLLNAEPDPELNRRHRLWTNAVEELVGLFTEARREELRTTLTGPSAGMQGLISQMRDDHGGPDEWWDFFRARSGLERHGLTDIVPRAQAQQIAAEEFPACVERSVLQAWLDRLLRDDARLKTIRAMERDGLVQEFRKLDRNVVRDANAQVIDACNDRRPHPSRGQAAVIRREAEKRSRHKSVRMLLQEAAETIRRLKPCFMMSPLTVSQYLPADYEFDVVIFDEASQVLPGDAVNCVYRGRALVVAGDQNQLPPTNFFSRAEDAEDAYDEGTPETFESLLDACKASGRIPSLSLRWHYRSHHEDLIGFSNRSFYDSGLTTFPGAHQDGDDAGVALIRVNGIYDRGRSRTNIAEARAVAERVRHHFETRPSMSLGVVALSDAQAGAVEDAVEEIRRLNPHLDRWFTEDRLDGFFVKNLETVQGDERDVMILSIGYARDHSGRLSMNFGPLNSADGWRRLNVAITRARNRVEVVSSISAADIDEGENLSRGYLKRYLEFTEKGASVLGALPSDLRAPELTTFERTVLETLRGWGYTAEPQVGIGSYRIDVGLRHPDAPERFLLAVECDGPMYASSAVARDRDRLRGEVLTRLGWHSYRIWCGDWYRDRDGAEHRLREAIHKAAATENVAVTGSEALDSTPRQEQTSNVITHYIDEDELNRSWASPYVEATPSTPGWAPEIQTPEARPQLMKTIMEVVHRESPVHVDVLFTRVRDAWSVGRLGERIKQNLRETLQLLQEQRSIALLDGFVFLNLTSETVPFRPGAVTPRYPGGSGPRKVAHVARPERQAAALKIVEESPGMSQDALISEVGRFFGWRRTGTDITAALSDDLRRLAKDGQIEGLPDRITLGEGPRP